MNAADTSGRTASAGGLKPASAQPAAAGTARRRWLRGLAVLGAVAALGATFAAYLDPHTVVDLANRVWSCF